MRIHSEGYTELKSSDAYNQLVLTPSGTNAPASINFNTPGTGRAKIKVQDAEFISILSTGKVGIGTSSPNNALRVVASASQATTDGAVVFKNEMNNGFETLKLETNNDRDSILSFRSAGTNSYWWGMGIDNSDGGKFKMGADNLLGVNNRLVITQSGNVGIGVTNPVEKLDIQGHQGISINNNYAHIGSTSSGGMAIFGHNIKSDSANNTIKSANTGYHSSMVKMYYNEGITFHSTSGTNTAGDTFYTYGGTTNELMRIANSGNVGIGTSNPSATLHVEDTITGGGNSGHMKLGHTRTRTFYAGISSSETRWYKVLNYGSGNMFTGKVQIYVTRSGGFNQTGAHKEYRASLGGYSNSVYGPLSLSGDGGEGGVASLEVGTDAGIYLRVNSSIYGGTVYVTFSGQGGMGWAYSNSSYSTSLP